jgi:hypothetical protein
VYKDLPANILLSKKENVNSKQENFNANCYRLLLFSAESPVWFQVLIQAQVWVPDERYWEYGSRAAGLYSVQDLQVDAVPANCLEPDAHYSASGYMDLLFSESDLETAGY